MGYGDVWHRGEGYDLEQYVSAHDWNGMLKLESSFFGSKASFINSSIISDVLS